MVEQTLIEELIGAIKQDPKIRNRTHSAVVARVDDEGVVWVYVAGSDQETPTATTSAEVKRGDGVMVEWRNDRLYIVGNTTDPSAGVARVVQVENEATRARIAADIAVQSAQTAYEAATSAQESAASASDAAAEAWDKAGDAQNAADEAGQSAITAQTMASAAGENAAKAQAAADAAQGDIDEFKEYFWHDALGAHILSDTDEVSGYRYRNDMEGAGNVIYRLNPDGTETAIAQFGQTTIIGEQTGAHVEIMGNRQSFKVGETEVAYIAIDDNNEAVFYMTKAIIVKDLQFSHWRWASRDNNNLALKWIDGEE